MKIILLLMSIAGFANSCRLSDGNNNHKDSFPQNISLAKNGNKSDGVQLDYFREVPDTIDGCGDYYSLDTVKLQGDRYVFLSRMSEVGIILLNGEMVYVNKDTLQSKNLSNSFTDVYVGNGLKVTLNLIKIKSYDEGAFYKGSLTIIKGNIKVTYKIHGQTGC